MDVDAKAWMRAWLMGTATAGLVVPGLWAGEGSWLPANRTKSAAPALLKPSSGAVRPVAHQQMDGDVTVAESEIEQQLRLLYERDGREMPDMNLSSAPGTQPLPQVQPGVGPAPRLQQTPPPRYSAAPPAAPKPSPNKFTSFFKKLVPGGNKKPQTASQPPRRLPPTPPQPPAYQPVQPNYGQQVVTPQILPQQTPSAGAYLPQPQTPAAPQATVVIPSSPVTRATPVTFGVPATAPAFNAETAAETTEFVPLPTPSADVEDLDALEEAEVPFIPASPAAEEFESPFPAETSPVDAAPPQLNDDFPDPFSEAVETEAAPEMEAAPQAETAPEPEAAPAAEAATETEAMPAEEETNPYSGKSLEEPATPAALPDSPDIQPATTSADTPETKPTPEAKSTAETIPAPEDDSTAAKMRRIIQRTDMKGLKGFCPVTLRDQRELADSKPEFVGTFRGQKFFLASQAALTKFEEDPARYAPAAYGADVVVLTNSQDVVEGTLDYAAWFKGRLYLFGSQKSHDIFVAEPERFATPPGID